MNIQVGKRYRVIKHGAGLVSGKAGKIVRTCETFPPCLENPSPLKWYIIRLDDFSHVSLPETYFEEEEKPSAD